MKYRLLLVDDEPMIRAATARFLSLHFDVVPCGTIDEARSHLRGKHPPDVVVTDLNLSGARGEVLLAEVRDEHPHIARVVLSGCCTDTFDRLGDLVTLALNKGSATPNEIIASLLRCASTARAA